MCLLCCGGPFTAHKRLIRTSGKCTDTLRPAYLCKCFGILQRDSRHIFTPCFTQHCSALPMEKGSFVSRTPQLLKSPLSLIIFIAPQNDRLCLCGDVGHLLIIKSFKKILFAGG